MSNIKDGGPAFPTNEERFPDGAMCQEATYGMQLRDYFAAKAMQGFAADGECRFQEGITGMAKKAYEWADAMLKAREGS
jgi:hypothetical protein